jgi:hypothetical protein
VTADGWTAIGTIALAAMTLAAVVTTVVITAQDRRRADERVDAEQKRTEDERRHALEQEQLAEAWTVVCDMSQTIYFVTKAEENTRLLWLTVANVGRFTITRLEARFCLDGSVLAAPEESPSGTSRPCGGAKRLEWSAKRGPWPAFSEGEARASSTRVRSSLSRGSRTRTH